MADFTLSSNMNLPVPTVGVAPGPTWASLLDNCLTLIDQHSHLPGYGVPIVSAALNINGDLLFNNNNLTTLKSARFQVQGSPLSGPSDLGCLYVSGVDLYFNDENGNRIQMTASGGLNVTSSGISSGTATASFAAGVLVVNQAALTPGNIQCGSVLIGNNVASSHFITLSAPNALASDYSITLPSLPASTLPLSITGSGSMSAAQITTAQIADSAVTTAKIADGNVTQAKLSAPYVAPTVQKFTSGSGTYTPPSSPRAPLYLRLRMVGGGGGGAGGGSGVGNAGGGAGGYIDAIISPAASYSYAIGGGGNGGPISGSGSGGGSTTFGTNTCTGGGGGSSSSGGGGTGGTATLSLGSGIAMTGGTGDGSGGVGGYGHTGAASPFGGAGGTGNSAVANTGSGGGGGASGGVGGNGGSGYIIVEEFYQ